MAKTLIDIDDDLLVRTQQALGTTTKKDTVNTAMRELLRRIAADELIEMGRGGAFKSLLDPDVRTRMWRLYRST
jgi:Arc/MetJ family transcription regulator